MKMDFVAVLSIIVGLFALSASGEFVKGGKCGKNLTWMIDNSVLTINGTGEMYDFDLDNPAPWTNDQSKIKGVLIEEGVTSVGSKAFYKCGSITQVSIAKSVQSLGFWAFMECRSLENAVIPGGVSEIADGLFGLCTNLKSVTIPDSVTSIGEAAFQNCQLLQEVKIPASTTYIGSNAFSYCYKLQSVEIPASVEEIDGGAFSCCTLMESITVAKGNKFYRSIDGVLFKGDALVQYPAGKSDSSYTIPDDVSIVDFGAFTGCEKLFSVTIPDSVSYIREQAFNYCSNLKTVTLPAGLEKISDYVFSNCDSLENIVIPETVKEIGQCAFQRCSSLTEFVLPFSVESVSGYAFANCVGLKTVVFQESINYVCESAFSHCTNLSTVYYTSANELQNVPFEDLSLKNVCVGPDYPSSKLGGTYVTPNTTECKAFQSLFNHCYSPKYVGGKMQPVQVKSQNAIAWENQTGVCGTYVCENKTGLLSWSKCNSTKNVSYLCMDEQCMSDWKDNATEWTLVIEYENVSFVELWVDKLASDLRTATYVDVDVDIGSETDGNGTLLLNAVHIDDLRKARAMRRGLEEMEKGQYCRWGILCRWKNVYILNDTQSSSSQTPPPASHSSGSISNHVVMSAMAMALVVFVIIEGLMG